MTLRSPSLLLALSLLACSNGATGPDGALEGGASAETRPERYIRSDVSRRLVIELDAVAGTSPRAAAQSMLISRLSSLLDKPDGVAVAVGDTIPSMGVDHAWTPTELAALATATFDDDPTPGTIVMHVMWLDGHHVDDTSSGTVLGVAWDNLHVAMFHDSIEAACSGQPLLGDAGCAETQYGVWLHEIGHVVGLVDDGVPMVAAHEDGAHPAHDTNSACVMYWQYHGSVGAGTIVGSLLGGGHAPDFDAACLADLAAVHDR